ncbi:MAG: hypothetical protein PHF86_07050 [Candidatus Nanoarchaeia archaeon]|nr:hypothetical protein [Candidatus Nanoarchaeia archaeon]
MIQLINGRGQLGEELKKQLIENDIFNDKEAIIYHTWNFLDKSEKTQKEEYNKFKKYLETVKNTPLVFISTYSQQANPYNYYKQLSEAHLISNYENGYVIKLPVILGKGICQKFKDDEVTPYGEIELITIERAAKSVLSELEEIFYNAKRIKNIRINGDLVPAELVYQLIQFGKK